MMVKILADQILPAITEVRTPKVTGFLAMQGRAYSGELMVVGQAVNRWTKGIAPHHLRDDLCRLAYAQWVYRSVTENVLGANVEAKCPMLWVSSLWGKTNPQRHQFKQSPHDSDYSTRTSAFWRVIRSVVGQLGIANVDDDSRPWASHLVWSNLYKIAPFAGGNPDEELKRAQFNGCAKLLGCELEEYQPRRLLFLTGWRDWADRFLEKEDGLRSVKGQSFVEADGHVKFGASFARCIVASYPKRKKKNETERGWVDEVIAAFRESRMAKPTEPPYSRSHQL